MTAGQLNLFRKSRYRLFQTRDLDEARHKVSEVYCDHRLSSETGSLDAFHYHIPFAGISLNYMQYGVTSDIEPGCLEDFYLIQLPLKGHALVNVDGEVIESTVDKASVINPCAYTRMTWSDDCKQFLVQISKEKVEQVAAACIGGPSGVSLLFDSAMQRGNPHHAAWWRHLFSFVGEYSQQCSIYHNADILNNALNNIIRGLLYALNNNHTPLLARDQRSAIPRHVRLAVDYINSHSAEQLSMDTLVQLTGVSERCLYEGFKKFKHISPMRFLLHARLKAVRQALLASPGGTSVTRIASDHGFTQLGRFSATYKRVYGELPSATLARNSA